MTAADPGFGVVLPVRFGDCDAAGIAYYPRLLALVDAAAEDWTAGALGVSRGALHLELQRGLPTVHLESDFHDAVRLGDLLHLSVRVLVVGRSSVRLQVEGSVERRRMLSVALVQVLTDLAAMKAVPWPAAWRASLAMLTEEVS